jgi:hypothetical protein
VPPRNGETASPHPGHRDHGHIAELDEGRERNRKRGRGRLGARMDLGVVNQQHSGAGKREAKPRLPASPKKTRAGGRLCIKEAQARACDHQTQADLVAPHSRHDRRQSNGQGGLRGQ